MNTITFLEKNVNTFKKFLYRKESICYIVIQRSGEGEKEAVKEIKKPVFARFNANLKDGKLPHMLLLGGREDFLISWAEKALTEQYIEEDLKEFNLEYIEGADIPKENILKILQEKVEAMPLMGKCRVVVLREPPLYMLEKLLRFKDDVPETAYFIIIFKNLSDELRKENFVYDFVKLESIELKRFIEKRFKDRGFKPGINIINRVYHLCSYEDRDSEYDLYSLNDDLKKIMFHSDGETITLEDIDAGISPGLEAKIFTLMDSIATGQKEKAYKFLEDMLIMGESPVKILAMLIRKLENMACAKELLNMGKGPKEIGKLLGMKEYPVKITVNQSRNYTLDRLTEILIKAYDTDLIFKKGIMKDSLALETLIAYI